MKMKDTIGEEGMMKKIFNIFNKVWQNKKNVLLCFVILILLFICVRNSTIKPKVEIKEKIKTEYVVKQETIFIQNPIPKEVIKYKTIRDTVYVNNLPTIADIPIERKIYQDENYRAILSGFCANLDTLEIYRKDSLIYTTIEREKIIRQDYSRWAISIQGGYGFNMQGRTPYIGIGVSYDLIRFKKRR